MAIMGQNSPEFRVLFTKSIHCLERSTPPPVLPYISYDHYKACTFALSLVIGGLKN